MQWRTEVVGSCIDLGLELNEYLDQRRVTFARCQVERCETIGIGAIDNFKHFVFEIEILLGECKDLDNLSPVALVDLCPIVHLDFLDILLSISLCLRLLAFARGTLDRLAHRAQLGVTWPWLTWASLRCRLTFGDWHTHDLLTVHGFSNMLNTILLTIVRKLIGLFVVVIIADVDVDIILRIGALILRSAIWANIVIVHWPLEAGTPPTL